MAVAEFRPSIAFEEDQMPTTDPGTTKRHWLRRHPGKVLLAVVLLTASMAPAVASGEMTDRSDPRVEAIQGIIDGIARQSIPPASAAELTAPAGEPPDNPSPPAVMRAAVDQLDALLARPPRSRPFPPGRAEPLREARSHAWRAFDELTGDTPHLEVIFEAVQEAVESLSGAAPPRGRPHIASIERVSLEMTKAGRTIAVGLVDRAAAGGVDRRQLEVLRSQLAEGDQLVAQGRLAEAIGSFGPAAFGSNATVVFDMDTFEDNIVAGVSGESVGYAYAIGLNGLLDRQDADGLARTAADLPQTDQSPTKEMTVASVSKTITAVAVLKLLEDKGVSVDDSVAPYLPPAWDKDPSVEGLTFRALLTHTSGLGATLGFVGGMPGNSFEDLQDAIELGVAPEPYIYRNANFALMRIVIPYLWEITPQTFPGQSLDAVTSAIYVYFVQTEVLEPMGVQADCKPADATPTLLYPFPYDGVSTGSEEGDWTLICGAGGWFLSANELGSFIAHLRFDDAVLTPATRQMMNQDSLGWLDPDAFDWGSGTTFGPYYNHGGDLARMQSCIMNYPINVQVSLLVNSSGGAVNLVDLPGKKQHPCRLLQQAFDAAWVPA